MKFLKFNLILILTMVSTFSHSSEIAGVDKSGSILSDMSWRPDVETQFAKFSKATQKGLELAKQKVSSASESISDIYAKSKANVSDAYKKSKIAINGGMSSISETAKKQIEAVKAINWTEQVNKVKSNLTIEAVKNKLNAGYQLVSSNPGKFTGAAIMLYGFYKFKSFNSRVKELVKDVHNNMTPEECEAFKAKHAQFKTTIKQDQLNNRNSLGLVLLGAGIALGSHYGFNK